MLKKVNILEFKIDDKIYIAKIIIKNNKKTYVRVNRDLEIVVTTNSFATRKGILKLLNDNEDFLIRAIEKRKNEIENNKLFFYLGVNYDIIIINTIDKVSFDDNKVYVPSVGVLNKWYTSQIKLIFTDRLDVNYNLFNENISYPILKIRKMKSRWGSCNIKDNSITLNSNLMKYPIEVIDYVIIHELAHFIEFNHSKDFWGVVDKYCPDYKKHIKYLKNN